MNLDGKDGIGGVWHIDFLAAPEAPKKQGAWTIKRHYSDELAKVDLKAEHQPNKSIEIVLPKPANTPADVQLSLGVWNKEYSVNYSFSVFYLKVELTFYMFDYC